MIVTALTLVFDHSWVALSDLWAPLLLGVVLPGIGFGLFFSAISELGSSRAGVIVGTAPMLSALLALVFLDEEWTVPIGVGTVLTVVGGGVIAAGERSAARYRAIGLVFAGGTAVCFALRDIITRSIMVDIDIAPLLAVVIAQAAGLVVMITTNAVRLRADLADKIRDAVPLMLMPAILQALAVAALFSAFDQANVTVVAPINNSTQTIGVLVLGAAVLGRAEAGVRVVVAVGLVAAGALLVGLSP